MTAVTTQPQNANPPSKPKKQNQSSKLTTDQIGRISPNQLRYTIPQSAYLLQKSVAQLYVEAKQGKIRITKDGKRSYVLRDELTRVAQGAT